MTARRRGHKAPKGYDPSEYPQFAVTVDVVILTIVGEQLQVVLVRRRDDPYKGAFHIHGIWLDAQENIYLAQFDHMVSKLTRV